MYSYGSDNIHLPYSLTSREYSSKLKCYHVISHHCTFLWQEDPTSNVVLHQYTRHIFGAKDSPTCTNYALQRTASDNAKEYQEAAKAVLENFYMHDYLDSVESAERALIKSKELVHLLYLGGFKLTKFVSIVPDLADRIDGSAQSTESKAISFHPRRNQCTRLGLSEITTTILWL